MVQVVQVRIVGSVSVSLFGSGCVDVESLGGTYEGGN